MARMRKSAMMTYPAELTVITTAGYAIHFEPNEPKFVPALAVAECLKHGAKEVKRFRGTETAMPSAAEGAGIKSDILLPPDEDKVEVEEVEFTSVASTGEESTSRESAPKKVYTAVENKVRKAILKVIADADEEDFMPSGVPKVASIGKHATGVSITSPLRNKVWEKMIANGDVPPDIASALEAEERDAT